MSNFKVRIEYKGYISYNKLHFLCDLVRRITFLQRGSHSVSFNGVYDLPESYKNLFLYLDDKEIDIFDVRNHQMLSFSRFSIDVVKYNRELKVKNILNE